MALYKKVLVYKYVDCSKRYLLIALLCSILLLSFTEKDVARTDRETEMYRSINSPRLKQLQNILCTYIMYNFDLGEFLQ